MNKLPDKLSDLMLVAMEDLEKAEKDPGAEVDMTRWVHFYPTYCSVCFAGAVMKYSLGANKTMCEALDNNLHPCEMPGEIDNKLYALNFARLGSLQLSLMHMDQKSNSVEDYAIGPDFESLSSMSIRNLPEWKEHMCTIIGILQSEGL